MDQLPPRVVPHAGQRTVGVLTVNGRSVGTMRSGRDSWSTLAAQRNARLRIPRYLADHVEMKMAAMMIDTGATRARMTINNAPCGSESGDPPGCHQHLEKFLPRGSTLTVHGTSRAGDPITHTYQGRADP